MADEERPAAAAATGGLGSWSAASAAATGGLGGPDAGGAVGGAGAQAREALEAREALPGVTEEFIAASPVFGGMGAQETLGLLASLGASTRDYADGDMVIRSGDEIEYYPVVVSGAVRATIGQEGVERTVAEFKAGDSFAEAAAMSLGFCPASVWAVGATRVLRVPAVPLAASTDPLAIRLLRNISVQMSGKVQTLVSYISIIGEPRLEQRIFAYMDELERRPDGYVKLPLSQRKWADVLRVDEKSLSRKLRAMRAEGTIEVRRVAEGTLLRRPEWWRPAGEEDPRRDRKGKGEAGR